mgnify:FL=1
MLYSLVHSILREAESINAYGLFSLCLFFGFFTGVLVWAFRLKPKHLKNMGDLPLNGGECPHASNDKTQA